MEVFSRPLARRSSMRGHRNSYRAKVRLTLMPWFVITVTLGWAERHSPPRRGVSQLSCGQTITVRNFPLLGSGPILSRMWAKKSDTAAVSVGRVPSGACFGEPVEEFDPRPVRNNIGDAQPRFVL